MGEFAKTVRGLQVVLGEDADIATSGRYLSNRSLAVMGCGGFYLARRTLGLESAFEIDSELAVYESLDEAVEKTRFYLAHDTAREKIAAAGQKRVLSDYTYQKQFEKIFAWADASIKSDD
jgi:spore maturation protein CgeB